MDILFLDYETYSDQDLRFCGTYKYFETNNFHPLLLSYAFLGKPIHVWDFTEAEDLPASVELHIEMGGMIASWSSFDKLATERIIGRKIPEEQFIDVMIMAAEMGYPLALKNAGTALKCEIKKDPIGKAAIHKFCKPNRKGERVMPSADLDLWLRFKDYCYIDTELMMDIYIRLEVKRDAC